WTTTGNQLTIGAQAAGTGTLRQVNIVGGNSSSGLFLNPNTNTYLDAGGSIILRNWGGGSGIFIGSNADVGMNRVAAKVLTLTDANATNNTGWLQWAGQTRITADVSFTSTVTLGALATLSVALQAGRTYIFEAELPFTCAAAGGARAAMV